MCAIHTLDKDQDNPILLSERMLHKDYDRRVLIAKNLVVVLKGLGSKIN
jgi:hypothetical protein